MKLDFQNQESFRQIKINSEKYFKLATQKPSAYLQQGLRLQELEIRKSQESPDQEPSFADRRLELQLSLYFATKAYFEKQENPESIATSRASFYTYSKQAALLAACELLGSAVHPSLFITGTLPTAGDIANKREKVRQNWIIQHKKGNFTQAEQIELVTKGQIEYSPVEQETEVTCIFVNKQLKLRDTFLFEGLYKNLPDGYALPSYCYSLEQWNAAASDQFKALDSNGVVTEDYQQPDLFTQQEELEQAQGLEDYFPLWFDLRAQYAGHNSSQDTTGSSYWNLYILAENLATGKLELLPRRVTTAAHRGSLLLTLPLLAKIVQKENPELLNPAAADMLQEFCGDNAEAFKQVTIKKFSLPEQMYFDKGPVSVAATQDGFVDVLVNKNNKMHLQFYCYNLDTEGNKIQPEYEPALFNFATHDVFRAAITWMLDNPPKDPVTHCSCLMSRFVQLVHVLNKPEPKYRMNNGKRELSPRWADVYRAIDWLNARRVDVRNNPDFNELIDTAVKKQYSNLEEQQNFKNRIYDFLGRNPTRDAMLGTYFDEDKDGNEIIIFKNGPLANKLYLLNMLLGQNGKIDTPLLQEPTEETGALAFSYSTEERELVTQISHWFIAVKTTTLNRKIIIDSLFEKAGIQPKEITSRQRNRYLDIVKAYLEERKAAKELAGYEIKAGRKRNSKTKLQQACSLTLIFDESSKRAERERKAIINADRRKKRQAKKVEQIKDKKQESQN